MPSRILIADKGRKFFVKDISKDYHCQFGFVSAKDLKRKSGKVSTNTGKELHIFEPSFIDVYRKIRRDAQIVAQKDIGLIIAETGLNSKSIAVDAGAGSGAMCCFLANIAKKVTAYEIREDFFQVVRKNIEFLGLKNITLKNGDIYKGIDEKNVDLVTLDLPEPWKVIDHASKALKNGGFLVSYSPSVPQMADFVNALHARDDFVHVKTIEIIERSWEVAERKVRPMSRMIGHTGYLSFARRV
ncbi:MAG: tRNA (adenine57-N1/adenine58-N1)-methyltransferase [archaeon GW2011_AR3]|nr:MAG: tRNA (adenine57-N1/adenine58-N1)-methyltransferase [archaeon GW2011_AR3]MBS3109235.1 tRNA (adenine-N1)-methyltransferase [Candidatus Woesearchaeota archaeon]